MQQRLDVKPHSSLGSESQARVSTHDVSLQVVIRTNCNQTLPVLAPGCDYSGSVLLD